jgi:hypothetical protein
MVLEIQLKTVVLQMSAEEHLSNKGSGLPVKQRCFKAN